jgi:hypothetical protein
MAEEQPYTPLMRDAAYRELFASLGTLADHMPQDRIPSVDEVAAELRRVLFAVDEWRRAERPR